jgi:hypothetical protein
MVALDLPWNCPSPYCTDPHNPSSKPVDGVVRCRSCGWGPKVTQPEPQNIDNLPGLFQPREPKKDDK